MTISAIHRVSLATHDLAEAQKFFESVYRTNNIATAVAGGVLPILMGYLTHVEPKTIILVPAAVALMAVAITPVAVNHRKPLQFQG